MSLARQRRIPPPTPKPPAIADLRTPPIVGPQRGLFLGSAPWSTPPVTYPPSPGRWTERYADVEEPRPYNDTPTYRLGAEWLDAGCSAIEDWGCGLGWFGHTATALGLRVPIIINIDGSPSEFAEKVVDLAEYRSQVDGIFMRHVLEHDVRWATILDNALASFTRRMFLVVFTPLVDFTHPLMRDPELDVPVIGFFVGDLAMHFERAGVTWSMETIESSAHYGEETMFRLEKA